MPKFGPKCAAGVLIGVAAVQLTGCGNTVKPDGAAKSVLDVVSRQTGFKPNDVHCPSGVKAKAHMRITKVDGDDVEFDVKTQPRTP